MSEGDRSTEIPPSSPGSLRPRRRRPLHYHDSDTDNPDNSNLRANPDDFISNESTTQEEQENNVTDTGKNNSDESDFQTEANIKESSDDSSESIDSSESEEEAEIPHQNLEVKNLRKDNITLRSDDLFYKIQDFLKKAYQNKAVATILLIIIIIFITPYFFVKPHSEGDFNIATLKENFSTQDDFLWSAFESGVNDVITRNRPSTFILLYQDDAKITLESLLQELSRYAICNIVDCSKEPITITDSILNSSEIIDDYGVIIDRYKEKLREKGVMIIKNLENVRGLSAQAFHSFCDEFTPLVHRSLFIFTMKVEALPGNNKMRYIEDYFKKKWTDVKIDTVNALITRISSMPIEIMP